MIHQMVMFVSWLMMLLLLSPITAATEWSNVKPGCQEMCGNVSVPYPFGIGEPKCSMNDYFFLNCSSSNDDADSILFYGNGRVVNISVLEGTMTLNVVTAYQCYNKSGMKVRSLDEYSIGIGLDHEPFMFSDSRNKFTVIGCDTSASMYNWEYTYGTACLSICSSSYYMSLSHKNSCSGSGCCQTSIPKGLNSLFMAVTSIYNYTNVSDFNLCGYAFLADERSFNVSDWKLLVHRERKFTDVVVEWAAKNETCEVAKTNASAYVCGNNTNCTYSDNVQGYRCLCKPGFEGNPYLPNGCQDIDECKYPQNYSCEGKCENTFGDYICHCPLGMHGNGKTGCQGFRITTIIAVVGAIISLVIISLLLYIIFRKIKKDKNFRENGGMILKQQRVRIFSEAELAKATDNYDDVRKLGEGGFGSVYKGVLADGSLVAVKKSKGADKAQMNEDFQREILTVSQVNHKNVVKLVGLCLETKVPLLVYEFISNGTLYKHIHDKRSQILDCWSNRLRVAWESALALDYLHSLADPSIIHGDVKSVNILLDNNYTAKVADFGASVLISPGQTNILATKVQGTFGYLDPEYLLTGILTAKSDVYSFGVVLMELLTGEKPNSNAAGEKRSLIEHFISALENNNLSEILGFQATDEGEMNEIEAVGDLAKRCVSSIAKNRPTMMVVSDELAKLKALHQKSWAQQNSDETQHLLGESSQSFGDNASPATSQYHTVISFQMENYNDSI